MGEVSLAYDDRLKRHVALKTLIAVKDDGREALLHEARAVAALSHPGIASIFDIIEDGDRAYIVMEYVEGDTLAARLRDGPLRANEATEIGVQICDALSAAHARHIIHRDLKPGNIMIGPGNRAKILDFGLARQDLTAAASASTATAASAIGGNLAGTVGYIAPEQMLGKPIDQRCDIYSLGAVLFEMFTGRRPFLERDGLAYALAATRQPAPHAQSVNASVSDATASVLARALATDPADRYRDAGEVAHDLRAASTGATTITLPLQRVTQRRSWRTTAAIAGLTLMIVAALGYVRWPPRAIPAGTAEAPAVLAILPVLTFDAEPTTEAIGAGIAATVFSNLSGVSGLNVIPLSAVSQLAATRDRDTGLKTLGVGWALQTTLRRSANDFTLDAALKRPGVAEPEWRTSVSGDALTTERRLMDSLARGLVSAGVIGPLSSSDRTHIMRAPTTSNDAFIAYAKGYRLLVQPTPAAPVEEIVRLFESAVERDPQYALAYAGLSEGYFAAYRQTRSAAMVDKASEAAQRALAIDPTQPAVQVSLSNLWLQTGRLEEALASADRAIALMPASDDALRQRGRVLAAQGKYNDSIAALQQAIAINPQRRNNHENMGFVQYQAGHLKEAADAYRRVTEIAPAYAPGFEMLGAVQYQLGETTLAIGNYEHAVRLGGSANAQANLAYTYYEVGRYEEALTTYQASIARDPKVAANYRNLGDVYTRLGRSAEARKAYESAILVAEERLRVNPSYAPNIALIALCEAKLGRAAAAERHAAEAMALQPKDRDVVLKNAETFARLGRQDRAIEYLRQAIALGYDVAGARRNDEFASLKNHPGFESALAAAPAPHQ